MTAEYRAALRLVAQSLPVGAAIPVPRDQLLALLDGAHDSTMPPAVADRMLTARQVAERLGTSPQLVYDLKKELGAVRYGSRSWRFPESGLAKHAARRTANRLVPSR